MRFDLANFNQTNLPEPVGAMPKNLQISHVGLRLLDLCIRTPGTGWAPTADLGDLGAFGWVLASAASWEAKRSPLEYVYVTVDQRPVAPWSTQRRAGLHGDAWVASPDGARRDVAQDGMAGAVLSDEAERTYLWSDTLPTEFLPGPFDLGADCQEALERMEEQSRDMRVVTYPNRTLLALSPYCVHRAATNLTGSPVGRTLIKLSFSRHRYNRAGNSLNPAVDYSGWQWREREATARNHRWTA